MIDPIPPVCVGIYDPFEAYPKIQLKLLEKVQLTNLHWRKNTQDALRSVTQLPYEIVEESPKLFDNHSPSTLVKISDSDSAMIEVIKLLATPYTRLMFIQCDNVDIYRSQVRPLVTAWKESNIEKANCPIEWTLVYVQTDPSSKSQPKVFEKLKVDNNETDGTEHCVLLKTSFLNTLEENESWGVLVSKLKAGILFSFSKRLEILRDALLNITDKPLLTIALKEGVARQFFNLRLFEDSLNEYNFLLNLVNEKKDLLESHEEELKGLKDLVRIKVLFNSIADKPSEFDVKSFIFARVFQILEALSIANPSLSVSSLHISELLDKLFKFIADVTEIFQNSAKFKKWVYGLIDEISNLDICSKILNAEEESLGETLVQISERFSNLFLLQRSHLLFLGSSLRNYRINGILTDIPILDYSDLKFEDSPLQEVLSTKNNFEQRFIEITESAIRQYSLAGRPRTVDVLSIDIALLDYQNGQHEKAALVLSNCPEFYGTQGWKFVGYNLLETYIDCLEHMAPDDEFFTKSKNVILAENYVYLLSSLNENSGISQISLENTLEKLYKLELNDLPEGITHRFDDIFSFQVDPHVLPIGSDTYIINVNIKANAGLNFKLEDLQVTLVNEINREVVFTKSEVIINKNNNVQLSTMDISLGVLKLQSISAKLGHVSLSHDFESNSKITIFASPGDLKLKVGHSTTLNFSNKTFSIFIKSNEEVQNIKLEVNQLDGSLELSGPIKVFEQGGHLIEEFGEIEDLNCSRLEALQVYEIIVPFNSDLLVSKILELFVKIKFETNDGVSKSQSLTTSLNTILKIEVSVQDIFKFNSLYSKFSIGTADPKIPIRLLEVDLKGDESYNIQTSLKARELLVFSEQPGNYFFRLDKVGDKTTDSDLILDIEYRDLFEESSNIWKAILWKELSEVGFQIYYRLLTSLLSLEIDYIAYELNSTISFTQNNFSDKLLDQFPLKDKLKVHEVISKFINNEHEKSAVEVSFINNHITINVPIPTVEILQQYELKLEHSKIYTALGEELKAELTIKSTVNKHENTNTKKVSFQDQSSNKYEVEIVANNDSWLINGQTKFSFELHKNSEENDQDQFKETTYKLSLIPLKIGKLTLPRIKITKEDISFKVDEYALEIDYKNENETIYVVSEKA